MQDIAQNPSYEMWKSSGKLYKNREFWIDKFFDENKNFGDNITKLRAMDIFKDKDAYESLSEEVFNEFFTITGMQAIPTAPAMSDNGNVKLSMPNFKYEQVRQDYG